MNRPDLWICGGFVVYLMLLIAAFVVVAWGSAMHILTAFLILLCALMAGILVIDMVAAAALTFWYWIQDRKRGRRR